MNKNTISILMILILIGKICGEEIDVEFDKYKSNDSINKYFYKNRSDSTFYEEYESIRRMEKVTRVVPFISPGYYVIPIETVLFYSVFYKNTTIKINPYMAPLYGAFAILPPISHSVRIGSFNRYRKIAAKHRVESKSCTFAKILYYTSTVARFLLPLHILEEAKPKNSGLLPPSILLIYLPSFAQLYALNILDDEIESTKSNLDQLNLSPKFGLIPANNNNAALYCGVELQF